MLTGGGGAPRRHRLIWSGLHNSVAAGTAAVGSIFAVEAGTCGLLAELAAAAGSPASTAMERRALPPISATARHGAPV